MQRRNRHASLSQQVRHLKHRWMMTYDDTPEIEALYRTRPMFRTSLLYSAQTKRQGAELLITDNALVVPHETAQNKLLAA